MTGIAIVEQIVGILVAGLTNLGTGLGQGIMNFVNSLAFTTTGEGSSAVTQLSVYFVLVVAFAGVALAIGLTTKIFNWLSNLGN